MSDQREELLKRRDTVLGKARTLAEKARDESRELTAAEADQVNAAVAEAKTINETLTGDARARSIMSKLDAMASSSAGVFGDGGQHLALTGVHAKTTAEKIIEKMPRDAMGAKALASGVQTTSVVMLPEVIATGRPAVSVLDVLPTRIVPPTYTFLRQNSRSFAAAPTAAGASKPVSDVGVVGVQNRLRVVATVSSAIDHYLLSDNVNLMNFVTDELVYAIRVALESQVLTGDGTGENFLGVLGTSGILSQSFSTNALTSVRKAITSLDGQGYTPSVIVLHGNDWEAIELLTASTGSIDTRGVPVDPVARRLWGYPVVINNTLGAKVGLVIGQGAVVVDLDGQFETKWTDAVNDDVLKNQVRCRVETRAGVSVVQPSAVAKVATQA
jgi:HK97 family phage major capsid protein